MSPPPYARAPRRLARLARKFVQMSVEYDARTQGRRDFLRDLRGLVTPAELRRLAHSPRACLPWAALRARGERTRVSFLGLSARPAHDHTRRVVVAALVTTRTDFATLRDFQRITLTLRDDRHDRQGHTGWQVADATGAGL